VNWKEYGLVTAFFVSLFIEMYGIPLTVLFASRSFATSGNNIPNVIYGFNFFGVDIKMSVAMVYGTVLMVLGTILIIAAWGTLYKNYKKNSIVKTGIYSYSRHPQYFGFILIIIGWLVGWPTFLTIIFGPILIFVYIYVCRIEENELSHISAYAGYKKQVPFFV
jgi:protein-S-isoprenylcysteine O-methyltransferase Ste14